MVNSLASSIVGHIFHVVTWLLTFMRETWGSSTDAMSWSHKMTAPRTNIINLQIWEAAQAGCRTSSYTKYDMKIVWAQGGKDNYRKVITYG